MFVKGGWGGVDGERQAMKEEESATWQAVEVLLVAGDGRWWKVSEDERKQDKRKRKGFFLMF